MAQISDTCDHLINVLSCKISNLKSKKKNFSKKKSKKKKIRQINNITHDYFINVSSGK